MGAESQQASRLALVIGCVVMLVRGMVHRHVCIAAVFMPGTAGSQEMPYLVALQL